MVPLRSTVLKNLEARPIKKIIAARGRNGLLYRANVVRALDVGHDAPCCEV